MYEQQPMKLASAEGLERDTPGAAFSVVPGIEIPNVLSFLATNDFNATVQGTEDLQRRFEQQFGPGDYRPDQTVVFWSFRVMIVFGLATVGLSVLGLWLTRRRRPFPAWLSRALLLALPLPLIAMIAGWLLSEIGRQPWTVAGELLTAASVSPGVSLAEVATSLTIFTLLYGGLAVAEAVLLTRHARKGVEERDPVPATEQREPSLMY
jgi:cytochrome d ubiquinol oxidase subunit I